MATESSMAELLKDLTPKQRETLQLLFWGQLSERQAALVLGIERDSVRDRRDGALKALRKAITARYLTDADGNPVVTETDAPPPRVAPGSGFEGTVDGTVHSVSYAPVVEEPSWLNDTYVPVPRAPISHITFAEGEVDQRGGQTPGPRSASPDSSSQKEGAA
jgi:hypothetical protein